MATALRSAVIEQQPQVFTPFKNWFDVLYATGEMSVLGAVGIFIADTRSPRPLLPKAVDYLLAVVCLLGVLGGVGYITGTFIIPTLLGAPVIIFTVGIGVFGLQIARREGVNSGT